jgi:archaellum component FlaC
MDRKPATLTERLNKVADDLEKKKNPKSPTSKHGRTATEALDRVEAAVKKL